jgi:hypothetical protein
LRRVLDKYFTRTSIMADNVIVKLESVLETDFVKWAAKQEMQNDAAQP